MLLSKLLVLATACTASMALLAISPFAILMACATFSLYIDPLYKRIFRLLNSKDLNSFFEGNNKFYLNNPKDGTFDKYKKTYFFLCSYLELELQNETNLALSKKQQGWNIAVFIASVLASMLESGIMFYSSYKVINTISLLFFPSMATALLPLSLCLASICAIGAFGAFYGVTAVAIRKKFRFNHPINSLKDKAELTMKITKLIDKLKVERRDHFEEAIFIKKKRLNQFIQMLRESVKLKVIFELNNKNEKKEEDWADKVEEFISTSFNELLIKHPLATPKNVKDSKKKESKKKLGRLRSFTK